MEETKLTMKYTMYCIFGPVVYEQDRITIWDYIAHVFGWLNWIEN